MDNLTNDQALAIAKVLTYVDGGCYDCAKELASSMQEIFPLYNWRKMVAEAGNWDMSIYD